MISALEVSNFKSIKHLKLDCKRINIFIGEPNTGKSNILEALGVFSYGGFHSFGGLRDFVRFERTSHLFHDENLDEPVAIACDDIAFQLEFKDGQFKGDWLQQGNSIAALRGNFDILSLSDFRKGELLFPFKSYRFAVRQSFDRRESDFLLPPSGDNLLALLLKYKELMATANQLFSSFGLRLGLRPQENKIEVIKQLESIIISSPYQLASDTLQRLVFHLAAIVTNRDSVLVLEEPESHAFPYHTKILAETIALDERNNQYFVSTHNPYFLLPLLEKCPKEQVAVYITYFEEYQTKAKLLSQDALEEITEVDIFSNLDRFLSNR